MKIDVDILGAFKNITIEPFENIIEFEIGLKIGGELFFTK